MPVRRAMWPADYPKLERALTEGTRLEAASDRARHVRHFSKLCLDCVFRPGTFHGEFSARAAQRPHESVTVRPRTLGTHLAFATERMLLSCGRARSSVRLDCRGQ